MPDETFDMCSEPWTLGTSFTIMANEIFHLNGATSEYRETNKKLFNVVHALVMKALTCVKLTNYYCYYYYIIMPPPHRAEALSDDACLTSVALHGRESRTERPRKTKIGTEVPLVTRESDTTFKVKRSKVNLQGRGILWRPPAQLVTVAEIKVHCTNYINVPRKRSAVSSTVMSGRLKRSLEQQRLQVPTKEQVCRRRSDGCRQGVSGSCCSHRECTVTQCVSSR